MMDKDRRRGPRLPKLMRFVLLWKRTEEAVFSTDASIHGIFLRSAVMPPVGSPVILVVPQKDTDDTETCIRVHGEVVRHVRRGDPSNPLGGIGIAVKSMTSPSGTTDALSLLRSLLGHTAPARLDEMHGPVTIHLPELRIAPGITDPNADSQQPAPQSRLEPVKTALQVFCKWRNMIIQANLCSLSMEQAILNGIRVRPMLHDDVLVRILSHQVPGFAGTQFTAKVDQLDYDGVQDTATVSLALKQAESGSDIRRLIKAISEGKSADQSTPTNPNAQRKPGPGNG